MFKRVTPIASIATRPLLCLCAAALAFGGAIVNPALSDGPSDNDPKNVRAVPAPGLKLSSQVLDQLLERSRSIREQLSRVDNLDSDSRSLIEIFPRAVEISLETGMFYKESEIADAMQLLDLAERRLQLCSQGTRGKALLEIEEETDGEHQLLVGGFRSRLDGSIQPLGLALPPTDSAQSQEPLRLDVWLHGRGERTSEAAFLSQRLRKPSEYTPANTVVLHPYGRYCNAFKFAGEIDVLEAIEAVQRWLPIDDSRITIRGFSMGGAGCWQMAVHYPDLFAAANPGAGFSETTQFLKVFQGEDFRPTWFQQKLLHWYDCPDWTNNLRHVPTVAYSGEIDRQKQAADVMAAAFEQRGMRLPHIIGPDTAHKIHQDSKQIIQQKLDQFLTPGKPTRPQNVDFTTYSLRYHKLAWLSVEGLSKHWEESRVIAQWKPGEIEFSHVQNIDALRIHVDSMHEVPVQDRLQIKIGSSTIAAEIGADRRLDIRLYRTSDGRWQQGTRPGLRKKPGLQGPIDDAFMQPFTFVGPDRIALDQRDSEQNKKQSSVNHWVDTEYSRAKQQWRTHMRGEVVEADCRDVDLSSIERNLILFGTPSTNSLIAQIAPRLPHDWDATHVTAADQSYPSSQHLLVGIYPNPFSPNHYVVFNSGFTYREYAYLNNARQIPMLPDWAIVDVSAGSTTQLPGKIRAAGFYDESWQINPTKSLR